MLRNTVLVATAIACSLPLLAACGPGDSCEVTLTCGISSSNGGSGPGGSGPGGMGPGGSGPGGGGGGGGGSSTCGNGTVDAGEVCFGEPTVYDTGPYPSFTTDPASPVALMDCDGDGDLDVITVIDVVLQVLKNDGNGDLTELATFTVPGQALGLEVADLTSDAGDELLINYAGGGYTDIYALPNCNLTTKAVAYHASATLTAATAVDINGSGPLDYAVIADNALVFGLDGSNMPSETQSTASSASAAVSGLFDDDGFEDVVYADVGSGRIRWALGTGNGLVNTSSYQLQVSSSPVDLVSSDFDGDGDPDLLLVDDVAASVSVLKNNGASNVAFSTSLSDIPVQGTNGVNADDPRDIALGDIDGDGDIDAATANTGDGPGQSSISLLLNDGRAGFSLAPGSPLEVPRRPTSVAIGDMNGDGAADIVTVHNFDDNDTRHVAVVLAQP